MFALTGQSCCAIERVYVHTAHYDAFLQHAEALIHESVLKNAFVSLLISASLGLCEVVCSVCCCCVTNNDVYIVEI
jgi:hypothetical protein